MVLRKLAIVLSGVVFLAMTVVTNAATIYVKTFTTVGNQDVDGVLEPVDNGLCDGVGPCSVTSTHPN